MRCAWASWPLRVVSRSALRRNQDYALMAHVPSWLLLVHVLAAQPGKVSLQVSQRSWWCLLGKGSPVLRGFGRSTTTQQRQQRQRQCRQAPDPASSGMLCARHACMARAPGAHTPCAVRVLCALCRAPQWPKAQTECGRRAQAQREVLRGWAAHRVTARVLQAHSPRALMLVRA